MDCLKNVPGFSNFILVPYVVKHQTPTLKIIHNKKKLYFFLSFPANTKSLHIELHETGTNCCHKDPLQDTKTAYLKLKQFRFLSERLRTLMEYVLDII